MTSNVSSTVPPIGHRRAQQLVSLDLVSTNKTFNQHELHDELRYIYSYNMQLFVLKQKLMQICPRDWFFFRKQPDQPHLSPAEPVWPDRALPVGHGETLEVPSHGPGGLPQ